MVAVQALLMNYFLLGLHPDSHYINDVLPRDDTAPCPLGCTNCSPVNGCLSCKPPFLLLLQREGFRQKGTCKTQCPDGYFGLYRGKTGFCTRCDLRGCASCLSRTDCAQCRMGRVLYKGKCKKKCPRGSTYKAHLNRCLLPRKDVVPDARPRPTFFNVSSPPPPTTDVPSPNVVAPVPTKSTQSAITVTASHPFFDVLPKKTLTKKERRQLREEKEKRRRRRRRRKKKRKKKRRKKKRRRGMGKNGKEGSLFGEGIAKRHWKGRRRRMGRRGNAAFFANNGTGTNTSIGTGAWTVRR